MSVIWGFLDGGENRIKTFETTCFGNMNDALTTPAKAKFMWFKLNFPYPEKTGQRYLDFLKSFWVLKDVLKDHTITSMSEGNGIVMDIDKYSGFEIFITFCMARYPQQFGGWYLDQFYDLSVRFPSLSLLQTWVLSHFVKPGELNISTEYGLFAGVDPESRLEGYAEENLVSLFPPSVPFRQQRNYMVGKNLGRIVPLFEQSLTGKSKSFQEVCYGDELYCKDAGKSFYRKKHNLKYPNDVKTISEIIQVLFPTTHDEVMKDFNSK